MMGALTPTCEVCKVRLTKDELDRYGTYCAQCFKLGDKDADKDEQ